MSTSTLDARLSAAADLVREGAVLIDVGTDHAYLPVHLCRMGKISRAVAADIGEGPLAAARRHIAASGLSGCIETALTDGLHGLEGRGATDIAICGMGGELIVRILSEAPFVKNGDIRLILQPMTRPGALRTYLAENGFAILREVTAAAGGRPYFCMAAGYTGVPYTLTRAEAELGAYNLKNDNSSVFRSLLVRAVRAAERRVRGLALGGRGVEAEEAYLAELRGYLQDNDKEEAP